MYRTAEFVSPKHPDKICDRISDKILDYCLTQDIDARVAFETMGWNGHIYVNGEITIDSDKEIPKTKISDLSDDITRNILERLGIGNFGTYKKDINFKDEFGKDDPGKNPGFIFNKGGLADQSRMKFNQGGFADAFAEARGNKQELFEWQGNQYTTRRADESDLQYENFLGKKTDNKVLLKEVPEEPADKKSFKEVTENIIIPKEKPIIKKNKKSNFSLFSTAEAAIPEDKE